MKINKILTKEQIKKISIKIFLLLLLTYILNNSSCAFSGAEIESLKTYESVKTFMVYSKNKIFSSSDNIDLDGPHWKDSILVLNTSFDRELVKLDNLNGNTEISNRKDIYDFLKISDSLSNYKYIIVDIDLNSVNNKYNDSLSLLIPKMKNIVVARSEQSSLLYKLIPKSGFVDYSTGVFTPEFVRFNYGTESKKSLPLYVYNDLTDRNLNGYLFNLVYFDGFSLCQKSDVLLFDIVLNSNKTKTIGQTCITDRDYYNINDFKTKNKISQIDDIKLITNKKIIVISDLFGQDKHMTYLGEMPGSIVVVNAYNSLSKGYHIINGIHVLLLFLFYFLIYVFVYNKSKILNKHIKLKYKVFNSEIVQFFLSFIGWASFFNLTAAILYVCFNIYYNAWYPTLWFTALPVVSNIVNLLKKK